MTTENIVEKKVSLWLREAVVARTAVVGIITVLLNLALAYGWLGDSLDKDVLKWLGALFDALTALSTILAVRPAVTPVADPKNNAGQKLVPVAPSSLDRNVAIASDPEVQKRNEAAIAEANKEDDELADTTPSEESQ